MIIKSRRGIIHLTGDTAKSFHEKMKYPNSQIAKKRDAYIKHAQENVRVVHKEKGKMIVEIKEFGEW